MKIVGNFITGIVSVLTAGQSSSFARYPHELLADGQLRDWRAVAKDIKRVQGKLKAEAHDGRKDKK